MPTGTCRFPGHHSPSAGPPARFAAALIAGALIIAAWHAVLVVLAVCAVLAVLGACMLLLVHSHRAEPYDAAWTAPEPPEALPAVALPAGMLQARVAQLELQLAERRQLEQPAAQHLHLHGLSAGDLAAVTARLAQPATRAIDTREEQ